MTRKFFVSVFISFCLVLTLSLLSDHYNARRESLVHVNPSTMKVRQ